MSSYVRTPLAFIVATWLLAACGMTAPGDSGTADSGPIAIDVRVDVAPDIQCMPGELQCNGTCTSVQTNNANCGRCGNLCPAGVGCVGGRCSCNRPSAVCGDACIDVTTSATNCGACGNVCAAGQVCLQGMCVDDCPSPRTFCTRGGVTCADLQTDRMNCGGCGVVCREGWGCNAGLCTCASNRMQCSGTCADTLTNPNHCGSCNWSCGTGGTCANSMCTCGPGYMNCTGACAILATDRYHCGACFRACADGQTCTAGVCVCPGGMTGCGTACVDTMTNMSHCGACGTACPPTSVCTAGACVCPTGQTSCGSRCTNTMTDANNCGACGNSCGAGGACAAGVCTCAAGYTMCGTACTQTGFDRLNCGACGVACTGTNLCVSGVCTAAPPNHYTFTRGTLPFVDVCTSPGAVRMLTSTDDVVGAAVTIPFMFPFFGRPYTAVRPSSNGYVLFGTTPNTYDNSYYPGRAVPDATRPRPAAFILNSDLYQRAVGGVCVATLGVAPSRRFVVQTTDATICCGDSGAQHYTFEMVLNESDGTLDYVYLTTTYAGAAGSYLIGAQNETATFGSTYEYRAGAPTMITAPMSLHLTPAP